MNSKIKKILSISDVILPGIVLILGLVSTYFIYHAPFESIMGAVQKIMYIHVGAAVSTYLMLTVTFIASICYLALKNSKFYFATDAASSVSFLFCTIVLITGMIWGHSSWNTWWRWEPRLTSVLILWVLLASIRYLSKVKFNFEEKSTFVSVLGILSGIQVPIVMFSIKLLNRTEQLHPEVVAKKGLQDVGYVYAMISSNFALMFLALWLFRVMYRVVKLEKLRLDQIRKG